MSDFIEISIVDTAVKCGIFVGNNINRVEIPIACPFCGDKKKCASLNTVKNLFHCNRCGEGLNPVSMYSKLVGVDTKAAYRELISGDMVIYSHSHCEPEREPKPLRERHDVYHALLSMLTLSDKHKANLTERGLDSDIIEFNMYRSVPDKVQADNIAETLSHNFNLLGIPGFYMEDGKWRISYNKGMFVPVRNEDGLIQGLQVRLDDAQDRKYRWLSSRGRKNGTKAYSWPHITNWNSNQTIFITEGALKADVAAYLSDDCYIGLPGVNCVSELIPLLKRMGVSAVVECLDMDKHSNKHVSAAADGLRCKLNSAGITCTSYEWDSKRNGIDDHLLFCQWLDTAA